MYKLAVNRKQDPRNMVQISRYPHSENTGQFSFLNVDEKTQYLTGTDMLLVSGKYRCQCKYIKCYQLPKMEHYASIFPDKEVSEVLQLLMDRFYGGNDRGFYFHITPEGILNSCILLGRKITGNIFSNR